MKFKNSIFIFTLIGALILSLVPFLFSNSAIEVDSPIKASTYFSTSADIKAALKRKSYAGITLKEVAYPDGDLVFSTSDISQDIDGYTQYKVANSPIIAVFPESVNGLPDKNFTRVNTAGSAYYIKNLAKVLEAFVAADSPDGLDLVSLKDSDGKPMFELDSGLFIRRNLTKISLPDKESKLYDDVVASLYYILNGGQTIKQEDIPDLKSKVSVILKNANMVSNFEGLLSYFGTKDGSILFVPEYILRNLSLSGNGHLNLVYNSKVLPSSTLYVYVNDDFDKDNCNALIDSLMNTDLWSAGFRNRIVMDPGYSSYKRYADNSINRLMVPIQDDLKELIGE